MITAVDSNILIDVFSGGPFAAGSASSLREARLNGVTIVCDIVYAEVAQHLSRKANAMSFWRAWRSR